MSVREHISKTHNVQTSPSFCSIVSVAVALPMCYVLPVLRMTSCLHIMAKGDAKSACAPSDSNRQHELNTATNSVCI